MLNYANERKGFNELLRVKAVVVYFALCILKSVFCNEWLKGNS